MNRREKLMYELSDIEGDLDAVKDFVDAVHTAKAEFTRLRERLSTVVMPETQENDNADQ